MKPVFHLSKDPTGVTIIDPIQRRHYPFQLSTASQLTKTHTDRFYFPVDNAISLTTERILLPYVVGIYVRTPDGDILTQAEEFAYEELSNREYLVELNGPIKVFLRLNSELTIASSRERMELDFGSEVEVEIGARSYHERPGATIITPDDPSDMMSAISMFGSALKTTSCERSLPSLRGHPPQIELGEELSIPDSVSVPDTGVVIEVPPQLEMIYPVSTLAYYLGATVIPGDRPQLLTKNGFSHSLGGSEREFQTEVERVLKQIFFFDCVTRTEGYYPVELYERQKIEKQIDLAFDELYKKPIAEQLEAYLAVSFEAIQEHLPKWSLTTYATNELRNIESLPYLVNNFSLIRVTDNKRSNATDLKPPKGIRGFLRGTEVENRGGSNSEQKSYVAPPETTSLEKAWIGSGNPVGANKIIKKSFENNLERISSTEGIRITVVCNEPEMNAEFDAGDSLYGERDELEFDITVHRNLSVDELRTVLSTETDFFHYIGHIDDSEFICRDGGLDAGTLDDVAIDTFLLNGCRSYEQGMRLIDAGSIGGVVTYSHVGNKNATTIGRLIARLLNRGFSLRSALTIAREQQIVGNQYIVLGDGSIEITQSESGTPMVCAIEPISSEEGYRVKMTTYPTLEKGMGSYYWPYLDKIQSYFLSGGDLPSITLSKDALAQFLRLEPFPVVYENDIYWSTKIDLDNF
ncbi:hypothetical protein [Haladaptatus sp. DYF46]|uniref:hypothetical protein n=1 Tax=Haladaptatus sp. DYF46 TaxID=2886041 RepID=UPI001E31EC11|nr:hypothetical protein [Haladaptatus sp. DYF46]